MRRSDSQSGEQVSCRPYANSARICCTGCARPQTGQVCRIMVPMSGCPACITRESKRDDVAAIGGTDRRRDDCGPDNDHLGLRQRTERKREAECPSSARRDTDARRGSLVAHELHYRRRIGLRRFEVFDTHLHAVHGRDRNRSVSAWRHSETTITHLLFDSGRNARGATCAIRSTVTTSCKDAIPSA